MQTAVHVHRAADIGDDHGFSGGGLNAIELAAEHGAGDLGHLHREESAEAAAYFRFFQHAAFDALHAFEQQLRLMLDAESAQAVKEATEALREREARRRYGDEPRR